MDTKQPVTKKSDALVDMETKLNDRIVIERREVIDTIEAGGGGMPMIPSAFLVIGEYIQSQPPKARDMQIEFQYHGITYTIAVDRI